MTDDTRKKTKTQGEGAEAADDGGGPADASRLARPGPNVDQLRARMPTLTNEEELEIARLRSMGLSERPTPNSSASLLSLANAYAALTGSAPPPAQPAVPSPMATSLAELTPEALAVEMRDRFSLGDYTGALAVADELLARDPNHAEAERCAENCRSVLQQMYVARIGPLDRIPSIAVPRDQLRWLSIDHRAGFLLSHVDGVSTIEMILDVSGMPTLDALRILHELHVQNVITFR